MSEKAPGADVPKKQKSTPHPLLSTLRVSPRIWCRRPVPSQNRAKPSEANGIMQSGWRSHPEAGSDMHSKPPKWEWWLGFNMWVIIYKSLLKQNMTNETPKFTQSCRARKPKRKTSTTVEAFQIWPRLTVSTSSDKIWLSDKKIWVYLQPKE